MFHLRISMLPAPSFPYISFPLFPPVFSCSLAMISLRIIGRTLVGFFLLQISQEERKETELMPSEQCTRERKGSPDDGKKYIQNLCKFVLYHGSSSSLQFKLSESFASPPDCRCPCPQPLCPRIRHRVRLLHPRRHAVGQHVPR